MIVRHFPVFRAFASVNLIASCLVFFTGINCLEITDFFVPIAAKVGEDQQLSCRYQLGNTEALYFLRWHKDGNEFFRYMPKETPPQRFYNVSGISGIRVKTVLSNSTNVILTKVDVSASGIYRCEVSGEAPAFETDDREAKFNVIEPPQGRPSVTVSHPSFEEKVYDTIMANCSGPENRVAPQLDWTLASIAVRQIKEFREQVHNDLIFLPLCQTKMNQIPIEKSIHREYSSFDMGQRKKTTSTLYLETEWIEDVLIPQLKESGHFNDLIRGYYIVLPLRCTSDIHGLFQDSDTVDITMLRSIPTSTSSRPVPASRDIIKSSKSSLTSTSYGVSTRHGAFTNLASSPFSHSIVSQHLLSILIVIKIFLST